MADSVTTEGTGSVWKCGVCFTKNVAEVDVCSKCFTKKDYKNFKVVKTQAVCTECKHKHWNDMPCHVFVPKKMKWRKGKADESSSDEEDSLGALDAGEEEEEEEESEDEGGEVLLGKLKFAAAGAARKAAGAAAQAARAAKTQAKKGVQAAKRRAGQRAGLLRTPAWAKNGKMKRCNCELGVPYEHEDQKRAGLDRVLRTPRGQSAVRLRFGDAEEEGEQKMLRFCEPGTELLAQCGPFLDPRSLGHLARVKAAWTEVANAQPHYYDMHYLDEAAAFQAYPCRVDAIYVRKGVIYTCGNKRIVAWDNRNNSKIKEVLKDSATLSGMAQGEGALLALSANGGVREFSLQHDPRKVAYKRTLHDHTSWVNGAAFSAPAPGSDPCEDHGLLHHSCWLCSVSDDREVKFWDTISGELLRSQRPRVPRNGTLRAAACSRRHLFAGSSAGAIYLYALRRECDREDRHECSLLAGPQLFCPQGEITHGEHAISALMIGGFNHRHDYLFSGSRDGTILVWELPKSGVEMERLTILDHSVGINQIVQTWSNLYTCADDETVKVWCLNDFGLQKVLRPGCRVKCLAAEEQQGGGGDAAAAGGPAGTLPLLDENGQEVSDLEEGCGYLYGGLSDGRVVRWRLGTWA